MDSCFPHHVGNYRASPTPYVQISRCVIHLSASTSPSMNCYHVPEISGSRIARGVSLVHIRTRTTISPYTSEWMMKFKPLLHIAMECACWSTTHRELWLQQHCHPQWLWPANDHVRALTVLNQVLCLYLPLPESLLHYQDLSGHYTHQLKELDLLPTQSTLILLGTWRMDTVLVIAPEWLWIHCQGTS